ncbi:hypothetical protein NUM3379_20170 [Kineococcus sp. NUM-3379]
MAEQHSGAAAHAAGEVSEVIRPAAVVPEDEARAILAALADRDVHAGGTWQAEPSLWTRFDRQWDAPAAPGGAVPVGRLHVAYGTPTRYEVTVFRVTVTAAGSALGWSVESLCDEALGYGGLRLQDCPRAALTPPPPPFRF